MVCPLVIRESAVDEAGPVFHHGFLLSKHLGVERVWEKGLVLNSRQGEKPSETERMKVGSGLWGTQCSDGDDCKNCMCLQESGM